MQSTSGQESSNEQVDVPRVPSQDGIRITTSMDLSYRNGNQTLAIRLRPDTIIDGFGQELPGAVVSVQMPKGQIMHFGLGACMTPVWANGSVVYFASSGDGVHLVALLPLFLIRPAGDLPTPSQQWPLREMRWFPLNGTDFFLAGGSRDGKVGLTWAGETPKPGADPPALEVVETWWQEPTEAGVVPEWLTPPGYTGRFRLVHEKVRASGPLLEPCSGFTPVRHQLAMQPMTKRATSDDPPVSQSLQAAIEYAESNPFLTTLQEWKGDPETVIYEWNAIWQPTLFTTGEETDTTWQLIFHAP